MKKLIYLFLFAWLLAACHNEKPLISDTGRLNDIERMLKIQKKLTVNSLNPIWTVLDKPESKEEEQALRFMYAYMPLSDLADYSPDFIKANVRKSLQARSETTWGKQLPEEVFLHFVLPLRVNNENLDSFRLVYYDELKTRIKGMTMKNAALEVNHWCHEKVNYRGTDSRTSAPLSTIRKTFGRCGEESTFTVSAMRAAGIPARQVYTPRWAHTDDNHAWVEVWIEGKWHYMGACEPDTDLDRGWFSEPSQRTMLIHTRTYGRYFGSEEILDASDRFSELNLTSNYARTKTVTVVVKDSEGKPATGAKVEFKLYNYAEFYPIATILTDQSGAAKFTTGLGDLLVWASGKEKFAFEKLHVASTDTLNLVLNRSIVENEKFNYDLVPPKVLKPVTAASDSDRKHNERRLAFEDSVRNRTMSFFKDSAWIINYAKTDQLAEDTLIRVLRLSYGNWKEMLNYIETNKKTGRKLLFPLTYGISDKDLSDTKASVLTDHLLQVAATAGNGESSEYFEKYVLAPRIGMEILSPWRSFLWRRMGPELAAATRKDMNTLINWIKTYIAIDTVANKHSRAPLTPIGVFNLRVADPVSRNIFFVASSRTFGIPARLNPETLFPEYYQNGAWYRANLETPQAQPEMGQLSLKERNNAIPPQYALHFTIARIENGTCQTLEFEEGRKLTDFPDPVILETGQYMLVTGSRLSDASVLSSVAFFNVSKDKPVTVEVELRKEEVVLKPKGRCEPGKINLKSLPENQAVKLSDLIKNQNSVVVLLDPESEPSKHILNDLAPYSEQFDKWKGQFIFVIVSGKEMKSATFKNYRLPVQKCFASDAGDELGQMLSSFTGLNSVNNLPVVFFCRPSGDIMMTSSGYKIGIGEQLVQFIKRLDRENIRQPASACTTP